MQDHNLDQRDATDLMLSEAAGKISRLLLMQSSVSWIIWSYGTTWSLPRSPTTTNMVLCCKAIPFSIWTRIRLSTFLRTVAIVYATEKGRNHRSHYKSAHRGRNLWNTATMRQRNQEQELSGANLQLKYKDFRIRPAKRQKTKTAGSSRLPGGAGELSDL